MDSLSQKYELPAPEIVWRPGIESGIGIYMLGREVHFAAPETDTEAELIEAGALRVGMVRFNQDPTERSFPRRRVQSLSSLDAVRRFGAAPV